MRIRWRSHPCVDCGKWLQLGTAWCPSCKREQPWFVGVTGARGARLYARARWAVRKLGGLAFGAGVVTALVALFTWSGRALLLSLAWHALSFACYWLTTTRAQMESDAGLR